MESRSKLAYLYQEYRKKPVAGQLNECMFSLLNNRLDRAAAHGLRFASMMN